MKKILSLMLCIFMCVFAVPFEAMAAPEIIGVYDSLGSGGMITVTNPAKKYSTTYSKTYSISGFAAAGSSVYVYIYDSASAVYRPYIENGVFVSCTVGASGIFVLPANLTAGKNTFLVRCEKDGVYQNTIFDINVLSASMFNIRNSLKNIKIN